jgi:Xaa-Pro aminopeptidase
MVFRLKGDLTMFEAGTYAQRRERLRKQVGTGLILILGNEDSPMNYAANAYHFKQDNSFLYYFGLDTPGLAAVLDPEEGRDILFGDDIDMEDIIWMGTLPSVADRAARVGVKETMPRAKLAEVLNQARQKGRTVHFLPPYRSQARILLQKLLGIPPDEAKTKASPSLIKAVVAQRLIKSPAEVREIEKALAVTYDMYRLAMKTAKPGVREQDIVGRIEGLAFSRANGTAFPTILTINGQILHNHGYANTLKQGRLLVIDSGAESPLHYASDITRTIPVGGKFSPKQKEIYEIVEEAHDLAIDRMKPGALYRDIHLQAATVIASGLKDLGLMKGDVGQAVADGAHALFFPHGLGHQMGLGVHDMEDLGEDYVGYDDTIKRSAQFGLAYLRFAAALKPGHVLTVEPGLYFIPALIDQWKGEGQHRNFINYDKVDTYRSFGGVRIEDNVLLTDTAKGHRLLGRLIPKSARDIEKAMAGRA